MKRKIAAPETTGEDMTDLLRKQDLTVSEAAQVLQISEPTVYRLVDGHELASWRKTANSGIRIYTKSVIEYIKNVQGREISAQAKR